MSKLKIELYNIKNVLLGRIVEQDEELRSQNGSIITTKEEWQIQSCDSPSLDVDNCILFIRGSRKGLDDNWFSGEFETECETLEIAQLLKEMVDEINGVEKPQEIKLNKII